MGQFKTVTDGTLVHPYTSEDIRVNGRLKFYPNRDGSYTLGVFDRFDGGGGFRKAGFEPISRTVWIPSYIPVHDPSRDVVTFNPQTGQDVTKFGYRILPDTPEGIPDLSGNSRTYNTAGGNAKGRQRARVKLFDLVRSNWDLDCMFTMTFDRAKIDRTDYAEIIQATGQWMANRVRRNGLKYVAVPEYHADGEAIHLHGLCNFDALATTYSGHRQKGKRVYNITDFPFGFTAVKKIGDGEQDRHAVAVYVSKYITKSSEKVGGRYYLHGGKLLQPKIVLCELSDEAIAQLTARFDCKAYTTRTPIASTYEKYTVQHFEKSDTE